MESFAQVALSGDSKHLKDAFAKLSTSERQHLSPTDTAKVCLGIVHLLLFPRASPSILSRWDPKTDISSVEPSWQCFSLLLWTDPC